MSLLHEAAVASISSSSRDHSMGSNVDFVHLLLYLPFVHLPPSADTLPLVSFPPQPAFLEVKRNAGEHFKKDKRGDSIA